MSKILLIAEHDNQSLKSASYHAFTAATLLKGEIDFAIIGHDCDKVIEAANNLPINQILVADNPVYAHQLAENTAQLIRDLSQNYDYVIMAATTFGKNILPRVAGLLNVDMLSDVIGIVSDNTFVRPIYAGNALATVEINEPIKLLTIRTTAFPGYQTANTTGTPSIRKIDTVVENELAKFVSHALTESKRPELTSARVIISGGRGLKSAENFKLLENIADQLGAAIGASRAAVDAGFAPNDYQVGQTGKVVAPDLYIAVGISGAIQHLAGMKDSKVIVAINNDPDAPIFQIADYALVGDLFKLLPELNEALNKR